MQPRVAVKFRAVAVLYLLVGAFVAFFHPWAANFRETGLFGLVGIGLFSVPLVLGLAYERARGDLDG